MKIFRLWNANVLSRESLKLHLINFKEDENAKSSCRKSNPKFASIEFFFGPFNNRFEAPPGVALDLPSRRRLEGWLELVFCRTDRRGLEVWKRFSGTFFFFSRDWNSWLYRPNEDSHLKSDLRFLKSCIRNILIII